MLFLYTIGIQVFYYLIRISSLFNSKAKKWVQGRKGLFNHLEKSISKTDEIIWFHCASLGEFEQGRPVLEAIKKLKPEFKIVLTFFSPSGYEVRKNYPLADYVFYLPLDTRKNAEKFIHIVNPQMVVFVKYEFWYHFINELYKKEIPLYIVSAIFRKDQHFFKNYGGWWRSMLKKTRHIFLQDEQSHQLLNSWGIQNSSVAGDTRFDRVYYAASVKESVPEVADFCANSTVFIAGSTWPEDENLLIDAIQKNASQWKFIIAPHEISSTRIKNLENSLKGIEIIKFSDLKNNALESARVLIIDNVGHLSKLYSYAQISYIGGGFGKGIHNILEACAFGVPVIFGPNFNKFKEAKDLISKRGAFSIKNSLELDKILHNPLLNTAGKICLNYVDQNKGATEKIVGEIVHVLK
ncbi:MAG: 3-deoxy-D-manno-octulosonic acid transferase [Bacteroidetes bacterium]|nr:3-deoxy-D-manno-octulosonic acid transferase [Bacteroidota bacterium]HET6244801.1 glycosyltransferase N-terminal domain-containing protein [Bacteroidia bacterium]